LYLLTSGSLFVIIPIALLAGFFLPYSYVMRHRHRRLDQLLQQLPDAMDFIARSLRAGNPSPRPCAAVPSSCRSRLPASSVPRSRK